MKERKKECRSPYFFGCVNNPFRVACLGWFLLSLCIRVKVFRKFSVNCVYLLWNFGELFYM